MSSASSDTEEALSYPHTRDEADELDALIGEDDPRRCPTCGGVAFLDVLDVWDADRAFTLDSCCPENADGWMAEMRTADRRAVAAWFQSRTGLEVRQIFVDEESQRIRLDFGLELVTISRAEAKAFILEHHKHHPPPAGDKYRMGVRNGADLIAVAMVGRPVAQRLDDGTAIEVNRLCVNRNLHHALTWNACSLLYGAAAREAKRRGYKRILTYLLDIEDGTSVRAAGWTAVAKTRGGSWNRRGRPRVDRAPTTPKVRWERAL